MTQFAIIAAPRHNYSRAVAKLYRILHRLHICRYNVVSSRDILRTTRLSNLSKNYFRYGEREPLNRNRDRDRDRSEVFQYQRTDAKVRRKFETSKCVDIQRVTNVTLVIFQKSLKIVIILKIRHLQR